VRERRYGMYLCRGAHGQLYCIHATAALEHPCTWCAGTALRDVMQ